MACALPAGRHNAACLTQPAGLRKGNYLPNPDGGEPALPGNKSAQSICVQVPRSRLPDSQRKYSAIGVTLAGMRRRMVRGVSGVGGGFAAEPGGR